MPSSEFLSARGQGLSREDIRALVKRVVDVVIQFAVDGGERFIEEVHFQAHSQIPPRDL